MGMAVDELAANAVGYIVQVKAARILLDGAVEHHLEKDIAQLFLQMVQVAFVNRLRHLIGFLQEIPANGLVGLGLVPLAAARGPKDVDDFAQIVAVIGFL